MASYFGNSFVKTKWLEKCPLERMPSFKTVSEHTIVSANRRYKGVKGEVGENPWSKDI